MSGLIPVLLYHSVADDARPWGAVSPARFAEHVDAIVSSGREPICISALAAALRRERPVPDRPVAVTFDDGYADTLAAVELLAARGISATVYVTTGQIGAADRLTAHQLNELARMPDVEIGAHGVRHVRLDELEEHECRLELSLSKAWLEELTGQRIASFAYPHGAYDAHLRGAVIDAGYESAAAVKNAISHLGDDPFAIARWTVTGRVAAKRLADVLEGKGVPVAPAGERWRTRAHRLARRRIRRLRSSRRRARC